MSNLHIRTIRSALFGYLWFFAVIFIPAWTLDYWQGWAFYLTLTVLTTLATVYIALTDTKLLESRLRMGPAVEETSTQKIVTAVGSIVFIAAIVLMVLDHRFGWSSAVPAAVSVLGNVLAALGILVYVVVVRDNRYAAATVQVVDGQSVVSTGPYAIVRHPMYTGALLVFLGAPLALGSWWGLLSVPMFVAGFAWRLLDEEKFLREQLPGYTTYLDNVHYRLVPYLW